MISTIQMFSLELDVISSHQPTAVPECPCDPAWAPGGLAAAPPAPEAAAAPAGRGFSDRGPGSLDGVRGSSDRVRGSSDGDGSGSVSDRGQEDGKAGRLICINTSGMDA